MLSKLKRLLRGEKGITGLETAIILIAFVVVAAVFAFTVLSAGVFSSDRSKESVYAGLSEVQGSMEVRGNVVAKGDTSNDKVTDVIFTVANVAGGEPIDLTVPGTGTCTAGTGCTYTSPEHRVVVDYVDESQHVTDLPWSKAWKGYNDGDDLLEEGELAELTVPFEPSATDVLSPTLGINTTFRVELKPQRGSVVIIERTTPGTIDTVMDLD